MKKTNESQNLFMICYSNEDILIPSIASAAVAKMVVRIFKQWGNRNPNKYPQHQQPNKFKFK